MWEVTRRTTITYPRNRPTKQTDKEQVLIPGDSEVFVSWRPSALTDEQIQASIDAAIAAAGYDPVTLEPTICFYD